MVPILPRVPVRPTGGPIRGVSGGLVAALALPALLLASVVLRSVMDEAQLRTAIVAVAVVLLIPAYKRFQARLHNGARVMAYSLGRAIGWLIQQTGPRIRG